MPPNVPRRPGSRPSRAAGIQSGLEHRLNTRPQPKSQVLARFRRQRLVEQVHAFGARIAFEFVDELARRHPEIADDIDLRLGRYAELDPEVLRAVGADRFPVSPVRLIGGAP
jgi:hypothetical protein